MKCGPYDRLQSRVEDRLSKLSSDKQYQAISVAAATTGATCAVSFYSLLSSPSPVQLVAGAIGLAGTAVAGGIIANANVDKKKEDQ